MSVPLGIVVVTTPMPREANVCWICAHPGATERDYQDHMRQLIVMYGWAVQGVERDGIHPPLVHADKRGRWPWDDAYQGVRGGQPVLGQREPAERRKRIG